MRKLLPILLILVGIALGGAAGLLLRPEPADPATDHGDTAAPASGGGDHAAALDGAPQTNADHDYVKLNNQFIVPVIRDGRIAALVVMALSVEITAGQRETVFQHEPKLRDAMLAVLFDHAALGGFDGAFNTSQRMDGLRTALTESAKGILPPDTVHHVLILDLVRQDIG